MTHSEPREFGRSAQLHGLYALLLAACIAIGAIAAAVALLDTSVRQTAAATGAPTASQAFAAEGGVLRDGRGTNLPSRARQAMPH